MLGVLLLVSPYQHAANICKIGEQVKTVEPIKFDQVGTCNRFNKNSER
jgi:hypothetical protein